MSLLRALTERHVTVDGLLFALRSVDSAALAEVGHAYVEGVQVAHRTGDDAAVADLTSELQAVGEDEETIAAAVASMRADSARRAIRLHAMAVSTPEGQKAYQERMRAYVCASVVAMGRAATPLVRAVPALPAYALHPVGETPEALPIDGAPGLQRVTLVDVARPEEGGPTLDALEVLAQVPLWALPSEVVESLGLVAAQLAGGRAASMAPFRALARDVRNA